MSTMTDRETVAAAVRIVRELTEDVGASTAEICPEPRALSAARIPAQAATQELIQKQN